MGAWDDLIKTLSMDYWERARKTVEAYPHVVAQAAKKHDVDPKYLNWILLTHPKSYRVLPIDTQPLDLMLRLLALRPAVSRDYTGFLMPAEGAEEDVDDALTDIANWASVAWKKDLLDNLWDVARHAVPQAFEAWEEVHGATTMTRPKMAVYIVQAMRMFFRSHRFGGPGTLMDEVMDLNGVPVLSKGA